MNSPNARPPPPPPTAPFRPTNNLNTCDQLMYLARTLSARPIYDTTRVGGEDHRPLFRCTLRLQPHGLVTNGTGGSKLLSRRDAAQRMLDLLNHREVEEGEVETEEPLFYVDREPDPRLEEQAEQEVSTHPTDSVQHPQLLQQLIRPQVPQTANELPPIKRRPPPQPPAPTTPAPTPSAFASIPPPMPFPPFPPPGIPMPVPFSTIPPQQLSQPMQIPPPPIPAPAIAPALLPPPPPPPPPPSSQPPPSQLPPSQPSMPQPVVQSNPLSIPRSLPAPAPPSVPQTAPSLKGSAPKPPPPKIPPSQPVEPASSNQSSTRSQGSTKSQPPSKPESPPKPPESTKTQPPPKNVSASASPTKKTSTPKISSPKKSPRKPVEPAKPPTAPKPSDTAKSLLLPFVAEEANITHDPVPNNANAVKESIKPKEAIRPKDIPKPKDAAKPKDATKPKDAIKPKDTIKPKDASVKRSSPRFQKKDQPLSAKTTQPTSITLTDKSRSPLPNTYVPPRKRARPTPSPARLALWVFCDSRDPKVRHSVEALASASLSVELKIRCLGSGLGNIAGEHVSVETLDGEGAVRLAMEVGRNVEQLWTARAKWLQNGGRMSLWPRIIVIGEMFRGCAERDVVEVVTCGALVAFVEDVIGRAII